MMVQLFSTCIVTYIIVACYLHSCQSLQYDQIIDNNEGVVANTTDTMADQALQRHGQQLSRNKRFITNNPKHYWPKAVVPYVIKEEVMKFKWDYLSIMAFYEANTCVQFVPWNETTTEEEYGIGHQGHLNFVLASGCWVIYTGVNKNKRGQSISCCLNDECVHELAHSMGFAHEQSDPLRAGWVRSNWNTMWANDRGYWGIGSNKDWNNPENLKRFPYDVSSPMHYRAWMFGFDEGSVSMLFPELKWRFSHFYMLMELVESYKCYDYAPCGGKKLDCVNDGYTSIVYGKCQCKCPKGLDPATLCAQPFSDVADPWPRGQYGLPKPKTGCPNTEFVEGSVRIDGITASNSGSSLLDGEYKDLDFTDKFCLRTVDDGHFKTDAEDKFNWPIGSYCFLKIATDNKCPLGFQSGEYDLGEAFTTSKNGPIPDWMQGDSIKMRFCCQYRGQQKYDSTLPTAKPFTVYKITKHCQALAGMKIEEERISIYGSNFKTDGWVPGELNDKGTVLTIGVCHYTPNDRKCGEGIVLGVANPETTIEISATGRRDLECTWVVSGDQENGTLVLDFENMDVKKENGKCVDRVEVMHARIGQTGLDYCGQSVGHSIRSITNQLLVRFHTDGESSSSFKAKVKWIPFDNLCYDSGNKGVNYDGKVNYTRMYEPCLPWAQMTQCYHHPFMKENTEDNLEGNYCRNPDNSFRPWCYTDVKGCKRNYCDVCAIETPYDKVDDCKVLKEKGFCSQDSKIALKYCASTCKDDLSPSETKPSDGYDQLQCQPPNNLKDGDIVGTVKSKYEPGDIVKFKCRTGLSTVSSKCMTSGTWSPVTYSCLQCPLDFSSFNQSCFGVFGKEQTTYDEAKKICSDANGVLPAPKTFEENEAVKQVNKNSVWIGVNDRKQEGNWVYEDGTKMTWASWNGGEPNNIGNEDCGQMVGGGGWNDIPCGGRYGSAACKIPKADISSNCNDLYGTDRCTGYLANFPDVCKEYKNYVSIYCRKTCGLCEEQMPHCSTKPSETNVEVAGPLNVIDTISVSQFVRYKCAKHTYKQKGDEIRFCLPNGKLSGEDLQCSDCPVGYKSTDNGCIGLASPGALLSFDEARKECSKVSGYVAMPRSPKENDLVSSIGLGHKLWIGATNIEDGSFMWEDQSKLAWNNFVDGETVKEVGNVGCVVMDEEKKWSIIPCDGVKHTTVCTIPKRNNFACYDISDRGASYAGTVNSTYKGDACIPWRDASKCKSNPFQSGMEMKNLNENYCRNPDKSLRPWCYTNYGCDWEYCNVCNKNDIPSDKLDDCAISRDSGLCTKDVEKARTECASTCSDLLQDFGEGDFKNVQCKQPTIPADAVLDALGTRSVHRVGDIVRLRCKYNKLSINITCLSSGRWSEAGLVCTECPIGYTLVNDTCYKWYNERVSQPDAIKICDEVGGILPIPSSKEKDEIIKSFLNGKEVWLGAKRVYGKVVLSDGSKTTWTNWESGFPRNFLCIFMKTGKWQNTDCKMRRPDSRVLCTVPKQRTELCEDIIGDTQCKDLLNTSPKLCKDKLEFSSTFCAKTCGVCGSENVQCQIKIESPETLKTTFKESSISVGDFVTYKCKDEHLESGGNKFRACQANGQLTGTELVCKSVTDIELIEIGPSKLVSGVRVIPTINTFFGENDLYTIKNKGVIMAWNYVSESSIKMAFQIWRRAEGSKYRLIGQNVITSGQNNGVVQLYEVPKEERIEVLEGDIIGIMNSVPGGVHFTPCDTNSNPGWLKLRWSSKYPTFSQVRVGSEISFHTGDTACIVFPIKAVLAKTG